MHYYGYVVTYKDNEGFEHPVESEWIGGTRCIVFSNEDAAEKYRRNVMATHVDRLAQGIFEKSTVNGYLWWKNAKPKYRPLTEKETRESEMMSKKLYVKKVKIV